MNMLWLTDQITCKCLDINVYMYVIHVIQEITAPKAVTSVLDEVYIYILYVYLVDISIHDINIEWVCIWELVGRFLYSVQQLLVANDARHNWLDTWPFSQGNPAPYGTTSYLTERNTTQPFPIATIFPNIYSYC